MNGLIGAIVPDGVCTAERRSDVSEVVLFPEERAAITRAVGKRRAEFATGRACSREALECLGVTAQAIPSGQGGAPRWPEGVVGSITHCERFRACAVARSTDFASIGIDAEPNQPLPSGVLADIALAEEMEWLERARAAWPTVCWDRLLFSIKESVYKTWFPLAGRWLGFEDAIVEIDISRKTFEAKLLSGRTNVDAEMPAGFHGRWLVSSGFVLAAIAQSAG